MTAEGENAEGRNKVGSVESRGIAPVPAVQRSGRMKHLFWTWFAANISLLNVTAGAVLVVSYGLNVLQAAAVTVTGVVVSYALVAVLSLAGQRTGAPGLTVSRAIFGQRGNMGPAVISWLNFVGWETVTCLTAAYTLAALLNRATGLPTGTAVIAGALVLSILVEGGISFFGHATLLWLQRWIAWIFGALSLPVCWYLARSASWHAVIHGHPARVTEVIAGIGFVAAYSGISWVAAGADYTRYLRPETRTRSIVGGTISGALVPLFVLLVVGALLATHSAGIATASDPVAAIEAALPSWMAVPYLLVAFVGLIAGADLTLYSSGLNLLTTGIRISRPVAILADAALIIGGGLFIVLASGDFLDAFTTFLTLLAIPLMSWAGIFAVDLARRRSYDSQALLHRSADSRYWYTHGFRFTAIVPWLAGLLAGLSVTSAQFSRQVSISGPLASSWLGHNGLGWLCAGLVASGGYAVTQLAPHVLRYRPGSDRTDRMGPVPVSKGATQVHLSGAEKSDRYIDSNLS